MEKDFFFFFEERKMSVFYTWLQVLNANLQHWVISIRLRVKPFSVVHLRNGRSWHAWFQLGPGYHDFPKRKQNSNTKSTSKMQNPKYLYISTNYCLLTRNQTKTFVLTQIHKCKRSVNRLFKGYLLIIYMKRKSECLLWCWIWKLNYLIKLNDGF